MKIKKQAHSERLTPVVLYLDDLERILEVLKGASEAVEISTLEYELGSLDEITNIQKETLSSLSIAIRNPYLSLEFKPYEISLFISEDTPISRGLFEKIKQLLHNRRRKLSWLITNDWVWVLAPYLIALPLGWFVVQGILSNNMHDVLLGCALAVPGTVLYWWTWQVSSNKYSIIHLRRRTELPSFWKRNKDEILIAAISAIVGSIVGSLITLAVTKLSK